MKLEKDGEFTTGYWLEPERGGRTSCPREGLFLSESPNRISLSLYLVIEYLPTQIWLCSQKLLSIFSEWSHLWLKRTLCLALKFMSRAQPRQGPPSVVGDDYIERGRSGVSEISQQQCLPCTVCGWEVGNPEDFALLGYFWLCLTGC